MRDLSAGDHLGRYVIEGVLGEGGMGRVYRGRDPALDRSVAIKVLGGFSGEMGSSRPDGPVRLMREARAVATLVHPNVVAIHDVGEIDGSPYLVMELVEGRTLKALVKDPMIPVETKLRWLLGVARALEAAHARGIVHRDVKPGNIIVRDDGVTKVLDFGVARRTAAEDVRDGARELDTLTEPGAVIGTPRYMAPEQFELQAADARTDQFAWGAVAYELLVGESPWKTADGNYARAIMTQATPPFSARVPGLPPEVEALVLRATSKAPGDRFPSMSEVVRTLETILGPISDVSRPRASGAASAASAPAHSPLLSGGDFTTRVTASVHPEGRRRTPPWLAAVSVGVLASVAVAATLWTRSPPVPPPAPALPPPPPPRPVALTDLPVPTSTSAEALAAYRAGMQAQRDGSDLAAGAFRHAVIADPGLAAAHLRLAGLEIVSNPVGARKDFEAATALRATLSEHDQTLLDALEPYIRRDPADLVETLRRLRAASQRYPLDADFALRVAAAEDGLVPFAEIHKQTARALELDPKFGLAYFVDAISYAYEGDFTAVQRVSDTCLREVPGADRCRRQLIDVLTQTGPCASLEALARTQTVASPSLSRDILADALAGEDRPVPLIRETLGPDGDGPAWTYTFEVLAGHFVAAEAAARELVANAGRTRGEHSVATRKLVELLREQGKDRLAGEVAQDYLKRKDAWIADPRGEDYAIARDPTPYMAWVAMKGGSLGPADLDRVRDEWLASWRTHVRPTYAPFLWLHAWAATADSREVADRALAARGAFEPIPRFSPLTLSEADVGRTLLAAGRTEEGITALREAAGSCLALRFPVEHTRAILALAEALEGQGDPKGACDGYARVLARWGEEKTSKSAARARARAKAIACSRR